MSTSEYPIIKNFLFFKEMGTDCIGVDYRAGDIDWNTRKPVKHNLVTEVYPFLAGNPNIWKRINILLEGVKKSNIPKLYSPEKIIHEENRSYLIYPLIKGKSFEQILDDSFQKDNPINFDLAFSIAFSIADLIDIGSSIVVSGEKSFHGFLTPDNIIIDYDGKIYLKNYGIYPYLSKEEDIFNEMVKKYGAWIAPEFMRKEKLVCQTDIYHLGYIIYKILTGKYFSCTPEEDFDAKFSNISFTQHIPSSDKNFLTDIIWFFKKTLHPQPSQRFANIKEFKDFISNKFHIEELSSVTFNLSYYMNTLYLDSMDSANEELAKEMAYVIPEVKKEEKVAVSEGKSGDLLVKDILSGLDEHEKKSSKSKLLIPLVVVVLIIIGISAYLYINQQKQVKEQERQRIADVAQAKKDMEARLEALNKNYESKLKEIETRAATTEEEKKANLEEMNKLKEWQKEETKKAVEIKKAEEDRILKTKVDEENQKRLDAEREQERLATEKQQEEAKKQEQAKIDALKKEEERSRIKPGQLLALTEVTKKPEKMKGKEPSFSPILRKKYTGNRWNIQVILLIMENGSVGNVRILTPKTPEDVKEPIINALSNWQYQPAQKGDIKVKVWFPVTLAISF